MTNAQSPRSPTALLVAACALLAAGCASAPPTGAAQSPHGAESKSSRDARITGWVVLSMGIEATAVAGVTSIMMLHQKSVRDGNCDAQKNCSQAGLDANNQLTGLAAWNAGAWVAAAAGLGVGTVLILTNPPESEPRTSITVGPNGSGLGLGLQRSF